MMLVFGANGASGRALLTRLPATAEVVAVLRRLPEDGFFATRGIATAQADVLDATATAALVEAYKPKRAISFVGGKNEAGVRSDATGNIHIINALVRHTPGAHFTLITSFGCGGQRALLGKAAQQTLSEALRAKDRAEAHLYRSPLRWCIVRPCGLNHEDNDSFTLHRSPTRIPRHYMSRRGLAAALVHLLQNPPHGIIYNVTA